MRYARSKASAVTSSAAARSRSERRHVGVDVVARRRGRAPRSPAPAGPGMRCARGSRCWSRRHYVRRRIHHTAISTGAGDVSSSRCDRRRSAEPQSSCRPCVRPHDRRHRGRPSSSSWPPPRRRPPARPTSSRRRQSGPVGDDQRLRHAGAPGHDRDPRLDARPRPPRAGCGCASRSSSSAKADGKWHNLDDSADSAWKKVGIARNRVIESGQNFTFLPPADGGVAHAARRRLVQVGDPGQHRPQAAARSPRPGTARPPGRTRTATARRSARSELSRTAAGRS